MAECKHDWEPHKNAFIKCKMCGANIVDFIIEQGKQLQQAQATIAAMRGALEIALHDLNTSHNLLATDRPDVINLDTIIGKGIRLRDLMWMTDNSK
ncbi:MAG: hypothetical protein H6Q67_1484, partial [Firmicutes bacterium]|nr:hypothetical protein [Bacillota bacterium]